MSDRNLRYDATGVGLESDETAHIPRPQVQAAAAEKHHNVNETGASAGADNLRALIYTYIAEIECKTNGVR